MPAKPVRYFSDLARIPAIPLSHKEELVKVSHIYPFRANDYYLGLIHWDDPNDPIRNLIIPHQEELDGWSNLDTCDELTDTNVKGLQHKFSSTALLLCNSVCGGHCRYCFRKRIFTKEYNEISMDASEGIEYISKHPEISNVLLTGGDPLLLSTRRLASILKRLGKIPHIKIIRIGTKIPAFNPWRILDDTKLLQLLGYVRTFGKKLYIITHFDHPRELTQPAFQVLQELQKKSAILCNQCPIIKGVNDNPGVLRELFHTLTSSGCSPYYIFQIRPTAGNKPFTVPLTTGYRIIHEAIKNLYGLAARVRFCMSHSTGKIEITGVDAKYIYLKYHLAKDPANTGQMMVFQRDDTACWFDQLKPAT